jgi:hypothetical protein
MSHPDKEGVGMRRAISSTLLPVLACALIVGAVACTEPPKSRAPVPAAAVPAGTQEDLSRRETSLIESLREDSADPSSGVESVQTPEAAASKVGFPVLVPAALKGRPLTGVYVERAEGSAAAQVGPGPNVYMIYGDDVTVSQYAKDDVGTAREALFGVLNNPPTNEVARETKVRGSFALKWDKGGRPVTMESTQVIWWEDGVSRWVGSYVLTADELVEIANTMK